MVKKLVSTLLALTLLISLSTGLVTHADVEKELTTEDYAYMDLDTAPAELRNTILEAREAIIYSQSWTVDGQCAIINLDDGTRTPLPEFYDLFPEDWDIPSA